MQSTEPDTAPVSHTAKKRGESMPARQDDTKRGNHQNSKCAGWVEVNGGTEREE